MLAFTLKNDGLGLLHPQETVKSEYEKATAITTKVTNQIYNQKLDHECNTMDQQHPELSKAEYDNWSLGWR